MVAALRHRHRRGRGPALHTVGGLPAAPHAWRRTSAWTSCPGRATHPADPGRAGAARARRRAVRALGGDPRPRSAAAGDEGSGVAAAVRLLDGGCGAAAPGGRARSRERTRRRGRCGSSRPSPEECFDLLLADEADMAVVVATAALPSTDDPRFEQRHLLEDPLDLLRPGGPPLGQQARRCCSADLVDEPWIMDRPGRPYHQLLQTACAAAGFTPAVAHVRHRVGHRRSAGRGRPRHRPHPAARAPARRLPGRAGAAAGDPTPSRHILTGIRRGSAQQPLIADALASLASNAGAPRASGEA